MCVTPLVTPLVFVQTDTCQTCVRFRMCVNPSVIPSVLDVCNAIGIPSVIVAQSCNFFITLCEIPTGYGLSVKPSVSVAQSCKFFSTLCEIPTGYVLSVKPSVKHKIFLIFFYVTLSQNLELQFYSTHNTTTRADH
jgi:hypothetical protein